MDLVNLLSLSVPLTLPLSGQLLFALSMSRLCDPYLTNKRRFIHYLPMFIVFIQNIPIVFVTKTFVANCIDYSIIFYFSIHSFKQVVKDSLVLWGDMTGLRMADD